MEKRTPLLILIAVIVAWTLYYFAVRQPSEINLTGIVTTDEVIVSAQIQGRLEKLLVKEGDSVTKGQLLAVILPQELEADLDYYDMAQQQYAEQIKQAQADLEFARITYERDEPLFKSQAVSQQDFDQARTAYDAAQARLGMAKRQAEAAQAQKQKAEV